MQQCLAELRMKTESVLVGSPLVRLVMVVPLLVKWLLLLPKQRWWAEQEDGSEVVKWHRSLAPWKQVMRQSLQEVSVKVEIEAVREQWLSGWNPPLQVSQRAVPASATLQTLGWTRLKSVLVVSLKKLQRLSHPGHRLEHHQTLSNLLCLELGEGPGPEWQLAWVQSFQPRLRYNRLARSALPWLLLELELE